MTTHADLASSLLNQGADFFDRLGEGNEDISDQMTKNAEIFREVAGMLERREEPNPDTPGSAVAAIIGDQSQGENAAQVPATNEMAAMLLKEGSTFFRKLAEGNPQMQEQMESNAGIFDNVATLVAQDPEGQLDDPE